MKETFLIGTTILGNTGIGFYFDKRIAIPVKNIQRIKEGICISDYPDILEKCASKEIKCIIRNNTYLGTYIDYSYDNQKETKRVLLSQSFDNCISQLKN